jgi:hypothetical protein
MSPTTLTIPYSSLLPLLFDQLRVQFLAMAMVFWVFLEQDCSHDAVVYVRVFGCKLSSPLLLLLLLFRYCYIVTRLSCRLLSLLVEKVFSGTTRLILSFVMGWWVALCSLCI